MSLVRIYAVIEAAERSAEPVAFETERGSTIVSLRNDGNLAFNDVTAGQLMYQDVFLSRYKHQAFVQLDEVPEIDDAIVDESYPALADAIEWANDPDTTDEQLQGYLADVAGEDDRTRKRSTHIAKIVEFVEIQEQD